MSFAITEIKPFGVLLQAQERSDVRTLSVAKLKELARRHHLVALRGFQTFDSAEAFAEYCANWGEISIWPFGKVLELIEQDKPEDHIFDNNYVPLHWDGMYRPQVPEFQMFHCVRAPGINDGGRTTFSNTVIALDRAPQNLRETWNHVTGSYHRKMEFYDSRTIAPLVTQHPVRGFSVIRYNEPPRDQDESFVNHPTLSFSGISDHKLEKFHSELRDALYAPECFYAHTWRTGDIVISDNYTLLHGREAFTSGAPRHLRRVHVLGEPPLNNPHLVAYA